ncbi:MAG: AAA family ATPase [Candidatus Omnitrophota bacterium]|nr:AAA family ATPase [Candidatus Omnitrophota bacterium]
MYEAYWQLKEKPFQNTPDPRFIYLSAQHEDALMKLSYCVTQGLGCAMLTGVFGCGKTLLGRTLLNDLGKDKVRAAFITSPSYTEPAELLRAMVRGLSPQGLPDKKTELLTDPLLEKLQGILLDNTREGKENVVIIDEAHTIEDAKLFEQLRLILNFQTEDRFLLTLLILGQPELKDKVEGNKPFDQRVAIRCYLGAFSEEDTGKYISHRVKTAGRQELTPVIFDQQGLNAVFRYSGGIPRRINTVCDLTLMTGFAQKADKINADLVNSVIKDFNLT